MFSTMTPIELLRRAKAKPFFTAASNDFAAFQLLLEELRGLEGMGWILLGPVKRESMTRHRHPMAITVRLTEVGEHALADADETT